MIPQKDILMLDASLFKLTKRCFKICYIPNEGGPPVEDECFGSCVENYVSSRAWVKERLITDLDNFIKKNEEIYKDFYK